MRTLNYITVLLVLNSKVDQYVFHKAFFKVTRLFSVLVLVLLCHEAHRIRAGAHVCDICITYCCRFKYLPLPERTGLRWSLGASAGIS